MRSYESSSAVASAKFWISFLSWAGIIIGGILLIIGFIIDGEPIGLIVIGGGIMGLITKALIKGFESIVIASEIYISNHSFKNNDIPPKE